MFRVLIPRNLIYYNKFFLIRDVVLTKLVYFYLLLYQAPILLIIKITNPIIVNEIPRGLFEGISKKPIIITAQDIIMTLFHFLLVSSISTGFRFSVETKTLSSWMGFPQRGHDEAFSEISLLYSEHLISDIL